MIDIKMDQEQDVKRKMLNEKRYVLHYEFFN